MSPITRSDALDQIATLESELDQAQALLNTTYQHAIANDLLTPEVETALSQNQLKIDIDRRRLNRAKNNAMYI